MTFLRIKKRKLILMAADIFVLIGVAAAFHILMPLSVEFSISEIIRDTGCLAVCILFFQIILRTYESLWRYAEAREYIMLSLGTLCGYLAFLLISLLLFKQYKQLFLMMSVSAAALAVSLKMRFVYRVFRRYITSGRGAHLKRPEKEKSDKRYIAIIGAGNAGASLFDEIRRNSKSPYRVWCFIDDDEEKIGRKLHDVEIKGPVNKISDLLSGSPVSEVILAIPSLGIERRKEILELCSALCRRTKILPDMIMAMQNEKVSFSASVRDIKPEDLLGRTSIHFLHKDLEPFLTGKVILVTGGGGSIGSELCRQIATYNPEKLIIFDIFENNAYILLQELTHLFKNTINVQVEIGSIGDRQRLEEVFDEYHPHIVFHAAAHKHVPLMERNPGEAVKNNILATHMLMETAAVHGCEKFVMISTDKAVNPTNVMGATKRYCEMMVKAMSDLSDCRTEFVAVRFGNVLGSNGSVVPLFMKQIEYGGPVTITDKRIARYFMTISEAASLVLKAGSIAKKSEVFVLDMGEPIKILTLAENLIKLSGYTPYKDIQIIETGLRPGEKLYEELLVEDGKNTATSNQKIFLKSSSTL